MKKIGIVVITTLGAMVCLETLIKASEELQKAILDSTQMLATAALAYSSHHG